MDLSVPEGVGEGAGVGGGGVGWPDAGSQERAEPALKQAGMVGAWLAPDQDFDSGKISLATLHSAKGLEFRAVAVVAWNELKPIPGDPQVNPLAQRGNSGNV